LHGRRIAVAFGVVVTCGAMAAGFAVDRLAVEVLAELHSQDHHDGSTLEWGALAALGALFVASLLRQGPRGVVGQITSPDLEHAHPE